MSTELTLCRSSTLSAKVYIIIFFISHFSTFLPTPTLPLSWKLFLCPSFSPFSYFFLPVAPPSPPIGVDVANIQPHSLNLSWDAQSGVYSYTVQYTKIQGASQLGECKNSTHSGSVSTTDASTSITVQGSGDDMVRVFTTYSITVTAVTVNRNSSAPSTAVLVTTAQTGLTFLVLYWKNFQYPVYEILH